MQAILAQLNVSDGGIPKLPVDSARVTRFGVEGDRQRNLKYHGGPNRAVCIFSEELYDWLRDQDIDLKNGAVGENFTTRGLDLSKLTKGDQLKVGNCLIEITDVRIPCGNLSRWDKRLLKTIRGLSGWATKVIEEGCVKAGDEIHVVRSDGVKE